jgi:hypothetical protein
MDITLHTLTGTHPVDTGWVDDALSSAYATGEPVGALVGRPVSTGTGIMLVGWPDGGANGYHVERSFGGPSAGPATYMQVVTFEGPRSPEWVAAETRATTDRIMPATRDLAGAVHVLRLRRPDGGLIVAVLADSVDTFDAAQRAILSTELLPGEDPALLTGPDSVVVYRLVHADLPLSEPVS